MAKIAEVQEVSLGLIKPYENNAKIHGDYQIQKLKDSIKEFGFVNPCLIDRDYNLIAGHGRVMAAEQLGMETVPCLFIEGLTEAQRRAYIQTAYQTLREYRQYLTRQQVRTLAGQIRHGKPNEAMNGLATILNRRHHGKEINASRASEQNT